MPIAQESQLKQSLRSSLCAQVIGIRERRRTVEERWLRNRRQWMGLHLESNYTPTETSTITNSSIYSTPSARRTTERMIVRIVKMLTPSVKWHEVSALGDTDQDRLSNVDNFMTVVLRKKIKSRSIISQLARCMALYSMPVLRTSVSTYKDVWPAWRACDPFAFYIFPETAPTIEDAELVFEDFLLSYDRYKVLSDKGIVDQYNRNDFMKPAWPYHLTERLAYQGITDPTGNVDHVIERVGDQLQQTTSGFVSLTELWLRREGSLYQVYIAWNLKGGEKIVGFFKSPYDEPLYRLSLHRPLPGETYTNSQFDDIANLEIICNDLFKMFVESAMWERGFMAIGDQVTRHDSWKMKERALWQIQGTPREVLQFMQPPITSTNVLRAWQICHGMMQSMGGAGTIAEGQPGRNMPRAGGAFSQMVSLGMADVQDIAEVLEQEVLTYALGDVYNVCKFIPEDQLIKIPGGIATYGGKQSHTMYKDQLEGDFNFEWVGSLQFQDEARNAQQMMIFLNLLPQLAPMLEQQGFKFNLADLIQRIWRYALGQRGLNKVITPFTPQEIQQRQQQQIMAAMSNAGKNSNGKGIAGMSPTMPSATAGYVNGGA
jgi:hypothetical protein